MTPDETTATADITELVGWRRKLDTIYAYLTGLFALAVLVQVFLAGVGVFGDHVKLVANANSFNPHRDLGTVLGFVALALFLLVIAARPSRSTLYGSFLLTAATLGAQPALANGGDSNKWVGGFHAFDGILILLLSLWLAGAAHRREAARRRTPA